MEEWKDIKNYPGYQVSNLGRVKRISSKGLDGRLLKEKILKGGHFSNTYKFVHLARDGKCKSEMIHRLVAEAFIPNPEKLPVVNHKDGNKLNNSSNNLEWCTQADNLKHAIDIGLVKSQCKIRRAVIVTDSDNHKIKFDSMKDCALFFGFKRGWVHNKIRKLGTVFYYQSYLIEVQGRG